MINEELNSLLVNYIECFGENELRNTLESKLNIINDDYTLTIIGNDAIHHIPNEYLRGHVYVASHGNMNLSTKESIHDEYTTALDNLANKLKEKNWKSVYFIPTGHTTFTLQIKLLIYHILRISSIDIFYSKGQYEEVNIDYRKIIVSE